MTMRVHYLITCSLLGAIAGLASAQPEDVLRDEAKRSFDRGMHHYNLGEFELALRHFKKAYDVSPHADLLFDIGQCHRNLGRHEHAIFFFERYVEEFPEAQDAEEVKALLVELRDRGVVVYDPPPLTATVARSLPPPALREPELEVVEQRPLLENWWFWAAAMGAAAVVAGSVVLIAALTDPADQRTIDPVAVIDPNL